MALKVSISLVKGDDFGGTDAVSLAQKQRENHRYYLGDADSDAYALAKLLDNSDPIDVADRAQGEYDVANVLLDCRLVPDKVLDDAGAFETLAQWYFRRFLEWRARTPHYPKLGEPQGWVLKSTPRLLPNPFERGFQHVFYPFSCEVHSLYDDVGIPLTEHAGRQQKVKVSSFLKHYAKKEIARVSTGSVCGLFRWIVEEVCRERVETEKNQGGLPKGSMPSRSVTVYVDDSLNAIGAVATLLDWLRAAKTTEQLHQAGCPMTFDVRAFDDAFYETKFDGALVFVTSPAGASRLTSQERRHHRSMTPRQRYVVVSDEEKIRPTGVYIHCPPNPFVMWDCIWESVLKALIGVDR